MTSFLLCIVCDVYYVVFNFDVDSRVQQSSRDFHTAAFDGPMKCRLPILQNNDTRKVR